MRASLAARVDEARRLVAQHSRRERGSPTRPVDLTLWAGLPRGTDSLALFQACLAGLLAWGPHRQAWPSPLRSCGRSLGRHSSKAID
jgi:hypothetical protein